MSGWMINCKEYAELTSQGMDRSLSFWDRVSMKIHQMLCPPCKSIRKQFDAIRNACRLEPSVDTHYRLSDEACKRMKEVILKASQDKTG